MAETGGQREPVMKSTDALLRTVWENSVQAMAALAPDGTVLFANRAALEVTGGSSDDVVGRPFWELDVWADDRVREQLRAAVARAAGGTEVREDLQFLGLDTPYTLDFSLTPVREAGAVTMLVYEGRDVTETRWAERALRISEARFAGIISIASDAIISVDENFLITLFNQGAETIFGYRGSDVLGQPLEMLLPERFRGGHSSHMRNFAAAPSVARRMGERQEIMGRRADGTEFSAEASISKLDLSGSMVFTVVLRDITERKRVERSQRFLARAGALLAASLDYETTLSSVAELSVPELGDWSVVYIREEDGAVRRLEVAHADADKRETLQRLFRYPLDPRGPHPVFAVVETGEPRVMTDIDDAFRRALSRDDEQYQIYQQLGMGSMLMVPLVARGRTRGAMGFFAAAPRRYGADELALGRDLAVLCALAVDNALLYRDAKAAVAARDDLIAVVSHDLGNPLSAIRIGTSLLLRSVPESEQGTGGWQHLEFIRESAQQMENLINDLLDVKKLEAGKVTLNTSALPASDLINGTAELFRPIAEGRQVGFACTVAADAGVLDGDRQRLMQVLSNLVGNALKFTEPGGEVRVEVRGAGDYVLFCVKDTGPGIPEEHLALVFDRFWQARREGRKGLGLGLAIARGIVEAHGGRIWAESVVGTGTTFLFTVPRSAD